MKQSGHFKASNSFFGTLLLLGFLGAASMTNLDSISELYVVCKTQWLSFNENLSVVGPHRVHFP